MKLLPRSEYVIERYGPAHVAAALHVTENGYLYWTKIAIADLPNELISADDLERFGIKG